MSRAIARTLLTLLALGAPSSLHAAQDAPLCVFAKRVLSERPSEFTPLKGNPLPDDKHGVSFKGTATPDESTQCDLHVRRKLGSQILDPVYACTKVKLETEEAKALYARYKTELATCFKGATVSETLPKASDPATMWKWKAQTVDYSAELEASNADEILANMLTGRPQTDAKMAVTLSITDLGPARTGAIIPDLR